MTERPRLRRPARAGDLLAGLGERLGIAARLNQYRAFQVWEAAVGAQIAAHARPLRIRDGILEVRVDQSVWMQQLQLLKPRILEQLNRQLAGAELRDIFWRHGRIDPVAPAAPPAPPLPPLSPASAARIDALLAPLADEELRAALRRVLVRQARLDQAPADAGSNPRQR